MKKILILSSLSLLFLGCVNSYPKNNIPPKKTFVKKNSKGKTSTVTIQKDDHRYDPRYENFNYDRLGYSNNMGSYYGYYDNNGYFYNNIYYRYDDRYRYIDRYNRVGAFRIDSEHRRDYDHSNRWNHSHSPYQPNYTRVQHPHEGVIEYGGLSYQNTSENVKARIRTRESLEE